MTQFALGPRSVESPEQRVQRELAASRTKDGIGLIEFGAAAVNDTIGRSLVRSIDQSRFTDDPSFSFTPELFDKMSEGIDPEYWPGLAAARSEDHALWLRNNYLQKTDAAKVLASNGAVVATGSRLLADLTDPVNVAMMVATGGISEGISATWQLGRLGSLATSGLLFGGQAVGTELIRASDDPRVTPLDIAKAGAVGGIFGSAQAASKSLGRLSRFGIGAASQALPATAIDLTTNALGITDHDADELRYQFLSSSLLGGVFNALPATMHEAAITGIKDTQFAAVKEHAAATGRKIEDVLSPKGMAYFKDQISPERRIRVFVKIVEPDTQIETQGRLFNEVADWQQINENVLKEMGAHLLTDPVAMAIATGQKDLPALASIARLSKEELMAKAPEGTRVLPNEGFGVRMAKDGTIEIGRDFLTARSSERQAMLEVPFVEPLAMRVLVENNVADQNEAVRLIQKAFGFDNPRDASVIYDRIRARVYDRANPEVLFAKTSKGSLRVAGDAVQFIPSDQGVVRAPAQAGNPGQNIAQGQLRGAMGAASPDTLSAPAQARNPLDLDLSGVTDAPSRLVFWKRRPMAFTSGVVVSARSEDPTIRRVANMTSYDPLRKADGTGVGQTAFEWAETRHAALIGQMERAGNDHYAQHLKFSREKGQQPMSRKQWNEEVGRAMARPDIDPLDPSVRASRDWHWNAMDAELGQQAKRMGVPGFEEWDQIRQERRRSRVYLPQAVDAAIDRYGLEKVTQFFTDAIVRGSEDTTPEKARILAEAIIDRQMRKNLGFNDYRVGRLLSHGDTEDLIAVLRDKFPDMTEAQMTDLLYKVGDKVDGESGKPTMVRKRITLDEGHESVLTDAAGNAETVRFSDFTLNDADELFRVTSRQLLGHMAFAEIGRAVTPSGMAPPKTIDAMIRRLQQGALADAKAGMDVGQIADDLAVIEQNLKLVMGVPLRERTGWTRFTAGVRSAQQIRVMSNIFTGLANAVEIGDTIAENGLRASIEAFPKIGSLIKSVKTGIVTDAELMELEILHGATADFAVHRPRMNAMESDTGILSSNKLEYALAKGQRIGSYTSLVGPVEHVLRGITGESIKQRWAQAAFSGKPISDKRLASLGISRGMADRIEQQIRDHALRERGITGTKVARLNVLDWTDIEAAAAMRQALARTTRLMVVKSDPTAYQMWMTTDLGRLAFQLRSYSFMAWRDKMLRGYDERNVATIGGFLLTTGLGAAALVARIYGAAALMDKGERKEYLEKNLSFGQLAKGTFSRSGYMSLLPTFYDNAALPLGYEPTFASFRTSGLSMNTGRGRFSDFLSQVPTFDYASSVYSMPSSVRSLFDSDYSLSRQDVKNIQSGLMIPNIFGVQQALNYLTRDLPNKSTIGGGY